VNSATAPRIKRNPYVGPRPFRESDWRDGRRLYGRDRETRDVVVMLMAERILLLHSPSGAGKTSLLQAKVIPRLRDDERFKVSPPLRVNAVPINGVTPRNRYVWSVIVGLAGSEAARLPELANMTLVEFIDSDYDPHRDAEDRVLVFDQLEEILTLDPGDRVKQAEFFEDLGTVLKNRTRYALLSIREDFMGGLAPYARLVPSHLKVRYRIDFLGHESALEATQRPAEDQGVIFDEVAAAALVKDLAKVRRQLPGEEKATEIEGPYVEPVQLQAVCTELWHRLYKLWGDELTKILLKDIEEFGDFDAALGAYYANALAKVAENTGADERVIRDWIEEKLITEEGKMRNQSQTGPPVGRDVDDVLRQLADLYLIRSDQRAGTTWYELAHDRLIDPLCQNNKEWRYQHLGDFEISAREWQRGNRADDYLLHGSRLTKARRWLKGSGDASDLMREFVEASDRKRREAERQHHKEVLLRGFSRAAVILAVLALCELAAIIYLLAR
jgi:hypothetical protein